MAKCIRGGNFYARHKYKQGICVHCKTLQPEQLKGLAKRREERRTKKLAAKKAAA